VTRRELLTFIQSQILAVEASVAEDGAPQAAVVGIVVSDQFEVFFDTRRGSRKAANLREQPRCALVVGWDLTTGCTVQLEGLADEPEGAELERLKALYFARFPDGKERETWPDITYFRVRASWLRYSDFRDGKARIEEYTAEALSALK